MTNLFRKNKAYDIKCFWTLYIFEDAFVGIKIFLTLLSIKTPKLKKKKNWKQIKELENRWNFKILSKIRKSFATLPECAKVLLFIFSSAFLQRFPFSLTKGVRISHRQFHPSQWKPLRFDHFPAPSIQPITLLFSVHFIKHLLLQLPIRRRSRLLFQPHPHGPPVRYHSHLCSFSRFYCCCWNIEIPTVLVFHRISSVCSMCSSFSTMHRHTQGEHLLKHGSLESLILRFGSLGVSVYGAFVCIMVSFCTFQLGLCCWEVLVALH